MENKEKKARELAEQVYGTNIHLWGQQRDGYVKGYTDCAQQKQAEFIKLIEGEIIHQSQDGSLYTAQVLTDLLTKYQAL